MIPDLGEILGESTSQLCINRMNILYSNTIQVQQNLFHHIKVIFKKKKTFGNIKNKLRTFQVTKQNFILENIKEPYLKIILKNCFRKHSQKSPNLLFSKTPYFLIVFSKNGF